jgi:hypothetical protein
LAYIDQCLYFIYSKIFNKFIIKIINYKYHQGNYLGTINYIWKILDNEVFNDKRNETLKACMLARIHEKLPHYFTQQMRKNVLNKAIII